MADLLDHRREQVAATATTASNALMVAEDGLSSARRDRFSAKAQEELVIASMIEETERLLGQHFSAETLAELSAGIDELKRINTELVATENWLDRPDVQRFNRMNDFLAKVFRILMEKIYQLVEEPRTITIRVPIIMPGGAGETADNVAPVDPGQVQISDTLITGRDKQEAESILKPDLIGNAINFLRRKLGFKTVPKAFAQKNRYKLLELIRSEVEDAMAAYRYHNGAEAPRNPKVFSRAEQLIAKARGEFPADAPDINRKITLRLELNHRKWQRLADDCQTACDYMDSVENRRFEPLGWKVIADVEATRKSTREAIHGAGFMDSMMGKGVETKSFDLNLFIKRHYQEFFKLFKTSKLAASIEQFAREKEITLSKGHVHDSLFAYFMFAYKPCRVPEHREVDTDHYSHYPIKPEARHKYAGKTMAIAIEDLADEKEQTIFTGYERCGALIVEDSDTVRDAGFGDSDKIDLNPRIFYDQDNLGRICFRLIESIAHSEWEYPCAMLTAEGNALECRDFAEAFARKLWYMEKQWNAMPDREKEAWIMGAFIGDYHGGEGGKDAVGRYYSTVHLGAYPRDCR